MKMLLAVIRYIHYTLGITTPRPEQERMVVVIWILATIFLITVSAGFFFFLTSQLQSIR